MSKKQFEKFELDNGLRVILVPQSGARSVAVTVGVCTGAKKEDKDNNGISHFLEHMFFKGTKKRPTPESITKLIDGVGGDQNAYTSKEITNYWVKLDKQHLELALDLVADMLLNSKFATGAMNREKGVIVEEINMYLDTPIYHISDLFEKLLYGNQPAGRSVLGTKENILNMKRRDFLSYIKKNYYASNMVVCLAGNFSVLKAKKLVHKYFNKVRSGQSKKSEPVKENQKSPKVLTQYKKTDQSHLWLGVRAYNLLHKDKAAVNLLATILGGYMSSRIHSSLREKAGLAYYLHTFYESNPDTGYLATRTGVPNGKIKEAIKIILNEYKRIGQDITAGELKRAKNYLRGKTLLSLESSDNLAEFYLGQELLVNKVMTPSQRFREYKKVTIGDIKRVAKDIFKDEGLNLTVIGPFKDKKSFLRDLHL